jgi:transketolase
VQPHHPLTQSPFANTRNEASVMQRMNWVQELTHKSQQLRIEALKMIYAAGSGHIGGSFSAAEIITTLLFHHLNIDPKKPEWSQRDRFILSKGHAAPLLYAALAERGFFPKSELTTFRQLNSRLQGHPDRTKILGIEMTSGVLGQGLGVGVGLALAAKLNDSNFRTYVLLGDGELDAGVIWEAVMVASKYKLTNITAIIDRNRVQLDGATHDVMPLEPLAEKWISFGWHVFEVDGHNIQRIGEVLEKAKNVDEKPAVIIAHTVKGKGVSFMENDSKWHGKPPNKAEYEAALVELKGGLVHQ